MDRDRHCVGFAALRGVGVLVHEHRRGGQSVQAVLERLLVKIAGRAAGVAVIRVVVDQALRLARGRSRQMIEPLELAVAAGDRGRHVLFDSKASLLPGSAVRARPCTSCPTRCRPGRSKASRPGGWCRPCRCCRRAGFRWSPYCQVLALLWKSTLAHIRVLVGVEAVEGGLRHVVEDIVLQGSRPHRAPARCRSYSRFPRPPARRRFAPLGVRAILRRRAAPGPLTQ